MKHFIPFLQELFKNWSGEEVTGIEAFPPSGSSREYYRLTGGGKTAIGVYHPHNSEYRAFASFTRQFNRLGLPVPWWLAGDEEKSLYLISDLGDDTLFGRVLAAGKPGGDRPVVMDYFRHALTDLLRFQLTGGEKLDMEQAYPVKRFNRQSMMWDLNYFKYFFLCLSGVPFHEAKLEEDFGELSSFLASADASFFTYRDFQSRNIHICRDGLYYIDYQGGRKGPLAYDPASLLFQARAGFTAEEREELLAHYLREAGRHLRLDEKRFRKEFAGFALLRMMQVLGAYGYRGWFEGKPHFIRSILPALENLNSLLAAREMPVEIPYLKDILPRMSEASFADELRHMDPGGEGLRVMITSFSYKNGIPADYSGNGGGFVFDCRFLDNPGRLPEFSNKTGFDREVIGFLNGKEEVEKYLNDAFRMVSEAVEKYVSRDFRHFMVNFGCTGGQHRSVYMAERLAKRLRSAYPVDVKVWHRELGKNT